MTVIRQTIVFLVIAFLGYVGISTLTTSGPAPVQAQTPTGYIDVFVLYDDAGGSTRGVGDDATVQLFKGESLVAEGQTIEGVSGLRFSNVPYGDYTVDAYVELYPGFNLLCDEEDVTIPDPENSVILYCKSLVYNLRLPFLGQ